MVLSSDPPVKNLMAELKGPRCRPPGDEPSAGLWVDTMAAWDPGDISEKAEKGFRSSLKF